MSLAGTDITSTERTYHKNNNAQDSVIVFSDCPVDAELVSDLLQRTGYRSEWLPSTPAVDGIDLNNPDFQERYKATILCHRKLTCCHELPVRSCLPGQSVIVLSDCESEQTVVSLLDGGADYFFNITEPGSVLQVRLEAALRHHSQITKRSFSIDEIRFDACRRLVYRFNEVVDLTPKEFDFAYYLFSNHERVVYNSELMTSVWSLPPTTETRRLDTAAFQIRKKLLSDSESGWQLKRLRSVGFRLERKLEELNNHTVYEAPLKLAVG